MEKTLSIICMFTTTVDVQCSLFPDPADRFDGVGETAVGEFDKLLKLTDCLAAAIASICLLAAVEYCA